MVNTKTFLRTHTKEMFFENYVREHYRDVYNVAYKKTNNKEDAEDLVQETFLRALRFFNSYDVEQSFENWLFKIMDNIHIDNHRKSFQSRVPHVAVISLDKPLETEEGEINMEIPDYASDPLECVIKTDRKESLKKALSKIKADFRNALILADIYDKSYEEISEITHTNIGTVRSRIHRARKELKEILGNEL